MPGSDWLPTREQDLADLCQKWKAGLSDAANVSAFGWKQAEVTAAVAAEAEKEEKPAKRRGSEVKKTGVAGKKRKKAG
jgi:hypothetical protein